MWRFLKNGLIFLMTTMLVYIVIFAVLCGIQVNGVPVIHRTSEVLNWKGGNSYFKFRQFDTDTRRDVIFIGSSHAYRGYDTGTFQEAGYKAFNLGSSAQTPKNSVHILKHLIDRENAGLVVIDVFNGALETDGLESTADLSQNYPDNSTAIRMAVQHHDPRTLNMIALRFMRADAEPMYEEDCLGSNGSCLIPDSVGTDIEYIMDRPLAIQDDQLDALEECVRFLKDNGIPVVLVDHPVPGGSDLDRQREFAQFMHQWSEERQVEFLDMSETPSLSSSDHFYDHTHLNAAGARLFSRGLLHELKRKGML